ncbi:MAG TPA: cyanophycin synthetase [Candidatus Limnocylindrales bacterium]|nr:cyanophycin synthetase [Candidatus Limnocylindrales bacterium]
MTGPGSLTYAGALAAIETRGRYGIRLGLGRVRALLRELGEPQLAVRGALVAGTNGKGSVIALAGSALRAAGYRVGETPKPHLVTYRERIVVDGRPISPEAFTALVEEVLPIADRIAPRLGPPTEFELLTAVMFLHFSRASLDLALVEVGLGGRLDATNAWDGGVAVLTNVGLDHVAQLGPTIGHIAREKAAIVKRGDVAVTGADGEALAVLRRRCARLGVPLAGAPPAPILGWTRDTLRVELPRLGPVDLGLRGRHQAANAAVADALLDALEAVGLATVSADARRRGYADARWPGRLELVEVEGPVGGAPREVLLDGAHNEDGARALAQALDDLRPHLAPGPLTVVWASMADKDVAATIRAVAASPALEGATVIATAVDLPRALPATELAAAWREGTSAMGRRVDVRAVADVDAAVEAAIGDDPVSRVPGGGGGGTWGPVLVAGSLYLVGAARARLVHDPLLRDPVP